MFQRLVQEIGQGLVTKWFRNWVGERNGKWFGEWFVKGNFRREEFHFGSLLTVI